MSRLIVVIMEQDQYPFGQCDNTLLDKKKVMVRKIIQFHPFQRKNILLKAKKIKSFINPYIIKLQQLLQQDSSIHLLFEYVPIKIQTWISNMNPEFIENFRSQLLQLADYLSQNSIVIDFKLKNIGMDQNYCPKYFIGIDYEINTLNGKDLLLQKYKAQICDILNTYKPCQISQKIISLKDINPQSSVKDETLKKVNQKSLKNIYQQRFIPKSNPVLTFTETNSQRNSFTKSVTLNESDMKLTFNGTHHNFFGNLQNNMSTNIKIENIGKKINDLRNLVRNIGDKKKDRRHDSTSLNAIKSINGDRPSSSYRKSKDIQTLSNQGNEIKQETFKNYKTVQSKQFRETQSQREFALEHQEGRILDKVNEKRIVKENDNQFRPKNEVKVNNNDGKRSYIYEFEKLLDDDIDDFAAFQDLVANSKNQVQKVQDSSNTNEIQKSPRFGFVSTRIQIQNHKTQPQRYSYSHATKRRKRSTESLTSNTSQIQQRVNAVIGASRKLISNFRKPKLSQKMGAY